MARLLVGWLVLLCSVAQAQVRCDCSQQTADCEASLHYRDGLLEVTTDTRECAQVLYYVDGQPQVVLVTDGRDAQPLAKEPYQTLTAGACRVCSSRQVSEQARVEVALQCDQDYLLETAETRQCQGGCATMDNARDRQVCEHNCLQYSRCLEKSCVQSLRQRWSACERRCDREMQSSMAADIDALKACQSGCQTIKDEISSCPVL